MLIMSFYSALSAKCTICSWGSSLYLNEWSKEDVRVQMNGLKKTYESKRHANVHGFYVGDRKC